MRLTSAAHLELRPEVERAEDTGAAAGRGFHILKELTEKYQGEFTAELPEGVFRAVLTLRGAKKRAFLSSAPVTTTAAGARLFGLPFFRGLQTKACQIKRRFASAAKTPG